MYYINKEYDCEHYSSKTFHSYFGGLSIGVLDIETTGLNPSYSKFVLGGLLTVNDKGVLVQQYFADNLSEEREALSKFIAEVEKLDVIMTFNGKHFDVPFLERRCGETGLPAPKLPFNLDIYLVLNGHSDLRSILPNLKQKTVENFMGLWTSREDEISGAESVELYHRYTRTHDHGIREKILLHNSDDVLQLYRLLPVLGKTDFHKAMYTFGFPVSGHKITGFELKGNVLRIAGKQGANAIDYINFSAQSAPYSVVFERVSGDFELIFPLRQYEGIAFIDLDQLPGNFEVLKEYPAYEQNCLVIKKKNDIDYKALTHFSKLFLEEFLEVILL